jgi:hypothetical protein
MSRIYRVHLASEARLSGTRLDGTYRIDLPEALDPYKPWQLVVEDFHSATALAQPILVWMTGTSHGGDAYNSFENAPGHLIGAVGSNVTHTVATADTLGHRLVSTSFLRGSVVGVRFSTLASAAAAPADPGAWVLSLVVMPAPVCNTSPVMTQNEESYRKQRGRV